VLVAGSNNSVGNRICKKKRTVSFMSALAIFMENAYLEEFLGSCILYFFSIGYYDLIFSMHYAKRSLGRN
jgi:hypothetical protein